MCMCLVIKGQHQGSLYSWKHSVFIVVVSKKKKTLHNSKYECTLISNSKKENMNKSDEFYLSQYSSCDIV